MTWIRTIPPKEAGGALRRIYEASQHDFGFIPNIRRALSLNPEALRAYTQLSGAVYGSGPLSERERELIATVVSALNDCHY